MTSSYFANCPECVGPYIALSKAVRVETDLIRMLQDGKIKFNSINSQEIEIEVLCGHRTNSPRVEIKGICRVHRVNKRVTKWQC
mgnify:CR=1 FL=1